MVLLGFWDAVRNVSLALCFTLKMENQIIVEGFSVVIPHPYYTPSAELKALPKNTMFTS